MKKDHHRVSRQRSKLTTLHLVRRLRRHHRLTLFASVILVSVLTAMLAIQLGTD